MPYPDVDDVAGAVCAPFGLPFPVPRGFVPGIFLVVGVDVAAFGSDSGVIVGGSLVEPCAVVTVGGGEAVAPVLAVVLAGAAFDASVLAPRMPR